MIIINNNSMCLFIFIYIYIASAASVIPRMIQEYINPSHDTRTLAPVQGVLRANPRNIYAPIPLIISAVDHDHPEENYQAIILWTSP